MINTMDLTNKKILVVGASSETGEAIVNQLLGLSAFVVMLDHVEEKLVNIANKYNLNKLAFNCFNIYNNQEIEKGIKHLNTLYGPFDGLVFCGGKGGVRPLQLTKNSFIHDMMNDNLYSFVEIARCITKKGCFNNGGSIVAISSVSSIKGLKSKIAYSASKAALDASVRGMASELSDKKIRVNSILKGWVTSDMKLDFIQDNMELSKNEDFAKQILGVIEPNEIANTVCFLLSDLTKTITGTAILHDGGYSL
ncbi:MAG: SDR family NAD(P)-dependent oxidoreductase [Bacteroidia bacterium]|jgi:NAD(P)-dependent dehydrogenase (short-subunit alcohol dehydrogenase family)